MNRDIREIYVYVFFPLKRDGKTTPHHVYQRTDYADFEAIADAIKKGKGKLIQDSTEYLSWLVNDEHSEIINNTLDPEETKPTIKGIVGSACALHTEMFDRMRNAIKAMPYKNREYLVIYLHTEITFTHIKWVDKYLSHFDFIAKNCKTVVSSTCEYYAGNKYLPCDAAITKWESKLTFPGVMA